MVVIGSTNITYRYGYHLPVITVMNMDTLPGTVRIRNAVVAVAVNMTENVQTKFGVQTVAVTTIRVSRLVRSFNVCEQNTNNEQHQP